MKTRKNRRKNQKNQKKQNGGSSKSVYGEEITSLDDGIENAKSVYGEEITSDDLEPLKAIEWWNNIVAENIKEKIENDSLTDDDISNLQILEYYIGIADTSEKEKFIEHFNPSIFKLLNKFKELHMQHNASS